MRLSARDLPIRVDALPDTARPIRMRTAGLVFAFTADEALDLAHHLADAVDDVKQQQKTGAS